MRLICKRLGGFLVIVVAILATSATAFAETGVLPTPGTVSVTSGAGKYVSKNGLTIKGLADEGTLKFDSDKQGTFDFLFLGLTGAFGVKCTGEKDTVAGSVLMSGTLAVVKLTSTETAPHGVLLSPSETKFSCGGIGDVLRGRLVGRIKVEGGVGTMTFVQSSGVNELTSDESESGIILETSTGGGKFEQSGLEMTETGGIAGELMS